ncbi:universal stress protein [Salinigranum sp. GCM10025319]|uniref:universal stress protein n=1 Tax=Salinigranum sp. GCM10025319 TaxID=3252687 RepID=UPI003620416A
MRLLVAIDGTDASDGALEYALDIATRLDATLLLAYVVEPAVHVTDDEGTTEWTRDPEEADREETDDRFVREALEDSRTTGDRLLQEATDRAAGVGVDADTRLVSGDPTEALLALAVEAGADGVVVGHRAPEHELVDSVARGLIDHSSVPVTVVT